MENFLDSRVHTSKGHKEHRRAQYNGSQGVTEASESKFLPESILMSN